MSRLEVSTVGYATYPLRTGEFIESQPWGARSTKTVVVNTLYASPFLVPYQTTWDRIAIEVTTLAALASARLGIYRNGTNLYPGTLLLDAGTVSVATTGIKTVTISQALNPGLYWLALVSDGGPVVRGREYSNSLMGLGATNFNTQNDGWSVAFTYAALPDPFTAAGSQIEVPPLVVLRLLSVP